MTSALRNDRFLRALRRESVDRTPLWIMRQAGRYLPEYRATRARAGSFLALAQTPELACEVTLQPLARYPLDAAILFSDILTVPDAMGLGLHFVEGEGPRFERTVRSRRDLDALATPDPEVELRYVMDAVRVIRAALDGRVPLIGFSGSPWTLACYMIEGGGSPGFARAKAMRLESPELLDALLDRLTASVAEYLIAQARAGAQALMVFDTWGGVLSPHDFRECSARTLREVIARVRAALGHSTPLIAFAKGVQQLELLAGLGSDALGLDWTVELHDARARIGGRVALQGNLDPAALHANPAAIRDAVARVLASYGDGPGHVFNLGHGVTPDVSPEHVGAMVDAVVELSPRYHRGAAA